MTLTPKVPICFTHDPSASDHNVKAEAMLIIGGCVLSICLMLLAAQWATGGPFVTYRGFIASDSTPETTPLEVHVHSTSDIARMMAASRISEKSTPPFWQIYAQAEQALENDHRRVNQSAVLLVMPEWGESQVVNITQGRSATTQRILPGEALEIFVEGAETVKIDGLNYKRQFDPVIGKAYLFELGAY